ncbi:MAG TPA: serine hydrolase domain-containing protein [Kofleriaceae bacterium]|nr:serine hydrolase domain-containing protein [Kofleriaceae bacterium]
MIDPPVDISDTLEKVRARADLPAIAGAVWRGPSLAAIGASGARKLGDSTRVTTDDKWHLSSDTKAMTATLIGIHVDRGRIHFEDTIGALFAGETIDPGYADVTLDELLHHRGGVPADIPADVWSKMWSDGDAPGARLDAVRAILSRPPARPPGTFEYSNAGYMIAGTALERATGASWEQLLQKELFAPLHMSSCGFGPPGAPGRVDQPRGHTIGAGGVATPVEPGPQADNPPALGPAGTVHCSLADWGKFLAVHLAGARHEATGLIAQATLTRLQTPAPGGDYACGWIVTERPWAGGTALTHSGSNTLWFATVWLAPARNLAFAVVTNRGDQVATAAVDSAFLPLLDSFAR